VVVSYREKLTRGNPRGGGGSKGLQLRDARDKHQCTEHQGDFRRGEVVKTLKVQVRVLGGKVGGSD